MRRNKYIIAIRLTRRDVHAAVRILMVANGKKTQCKWLEPKGDLLVHTTEKAISRTDPRRDSMQEPEGIQFLSFRLLSLLPLWWMSFSAKFLRAVATCLQWLQPHVHNSSRPAKVLRVTP